MSEYNTIILMHGFGEIEEEGDNIFGIDNEAREVMRWPIAEKAAALEELSKHRCVYSKRRTFNGTEVTEGDEWALCFCDCNEDGEYIDGGDYELASKESRRKA